MIVGNINAFISLVTIILILNGKIKLEKCEKIMVILI
jgi:hypothetical protein